MKIHAFLDRFDKLAIEPVVIEIPVFDLIICILLIFVLGVLFADGMRKREDKNGNES